MEEEKIEKSKLDKILVIEALSIAFLFFGLWGCYFFVKKEEFIWLSLAIYAIIGILYLFRKFIHVKEELFSFFIALDIGILIGSYLLSFSVNGTATSLLALGVVLVYFVVNFMMKFCPHQIIFLLVIFVIMIFGIVFSSVMIDSIIFRELLFFILYSLPYIVIQLVYMIIKKNHLLLINIGFFISYILVFIPIVFLL